MTINNAEYLHLIMPISSVRIVQFILIRQVIYGFTLKLKQLTLMLDIWNNDNFKSFKYMAKILGNTVADLLKCH